MGKILRVLVICLPRIRYSINADERGPSYLEEKVLNTNCTVDNCEPCFRFVFRLLSFNAKNRIAG